LPRNGAAPVRARRAIRSEEADAVDGKIKHIHVTKERCQKRDPQAVSVSQDTLHHGHNRAAAITMIRSAEPRAASFPSPSMDSVNIVGNIMEFIRPTSTTAHNATWPAAEIERAKRANAFSLERRIRSCRDPAASHPPRQNGTPTPRRATQDRGASGWHARLGACEREHGQGVGRQAIQLPIRLRSKRRTRRRSDDGADPAGCARMGMGGVPTTRGVVEPFNDS
jgi:hypothetical protein